MWMRRPWPICGVCEYSDMWPEHYKGEKGAKDGNYTCVKGRYIDHMRKRCRNFKRSHEKYYYSESLQGIYTERRLKIEEDDKNIYFIQSDELFESECKKYEKRKKKLEITFKLECTEEYLMERFGKPRISLKVRYDYRELKMLSIDAYADGEKFDCPFCEEDLKTIDKKSHSVADLADYIREPFFIEDGDIFSICRECEYSKIWPMASLIFRKKWIDQEEDFSCKKGFVCDEKTVCPYYKRSREKYYHWKCQFGDEEVESRLNGDDEDDYCLQYYELFDEEHKEYEKDKLEIIFDLVSPEKYLVTRFGKKKIFLKVKFDCKYKKVIEIEAYTDGEKFECPLNEEDLDAIRDKCFKVGLNVGIVIPSIEWEIRRDPCLNPWCY